MDQRQSSITKQLKALWRFKWMIILVALVAGGTALISTGREPPVYTATVTMMIESNPSLASLPTGSEPYAQGIISQMEIMRSREVIERAITQLEPGLAENPDQLETEVARLRASTTVRQFAESNLVGLSVSSVNPVTAQQQAYAVANAYIYHVQEVTQEAIETVITNTTQRMRDLMTREIDLSNNPQLTRLAAQFDTAIPALQSALIQLQQMEHGIAAPSADDAGTVLTSSQLDIILRQMTEVTDEANQITTLTTQLRLVSKESDFAVRTANIAIIESRMRALNTKLESLTSEVHGVESVEIEPGVQAELQTVREHLQIASATGGAILGQVVSLYSVQSQYRQAETAETPNAAQIALYEESDENTLNRIIEHTNLMAVSLETASDQVQQIIPRPGTLTKWRLQALEKRTATVITMLQDISSQLLPSSPDQVILLDQGEIASLEIRGQTVSLTMSSLISELRTARSEGTSLEVSTGIIGVQDLVNEANGAIGNLGNDITRLSEEESSSLSYTALDQLRQELQYTLLGLEDSANSRIVDSAIAAEASDIFTKYRGTILATLAGLFIAGLAAMTLQYFDRTAREAGQVEEYTGLPLLAQIAKVKYSDNPGGPPSVLTERMYQCLEAFRLLRTNLTSDSTRGQVLLVTSASEKEGKTTIAANLARVVALQGRRVLLIDGNLRKPGLAEAFGMKAEEGLSEFLRGTQEPWDYITQVDGVDIIPSGMASITSAEMLSSPRMKTLLQNAKEMFEVVILDSAPVMGCADTRILAREVDNVVMVIKTDSSSLDLVKASMTALEGMGARLAGFVLNKVQPKECKFLSPPRIKDKQQEEIDIESPANVA